MRKPNIIAAIAALAPIAVLSACATPNDYPPPVHVSQADCHVVESTNATIPGLLVSACAHPNQDGGGAPSTNGGTH